MVNVNVEIVFDKIIDSSMLSGEKLIESLGGPNSESSITSEQIECVPNFHEPALRRSNRISKVPEKLKDYEVSINCCKSRYTIQTVCSLSHNLSPHYLCVVHNLDKIREPDSVNDALKDPNWKSIMNKEMDALINAKIWVLTDLPSDRKAVDCKWVYKIKYKSDGTVERYKTRLVAKEYS